MHLLPMPFGGTGAGAGERGATYIGPPAPPYIAGHPRGQLVRPRRCPPRHHRAPARHTIHRKALSSLCARCRTPNMDRVRHHVLSSPTCRPTPWERFARWRKVLERSPPHIYFGAPIHSAPGLPESGCRVLLNQCAGYSRSYFYFAACQTPRITVDGLTGGRGEKTTL